MKDQILILGASSFAGYSFSKYLIKKKNIKFLEHTHQIEIKKFFTSKKMMKLN